MADTSGHWEFLRQAADGDVVAALSAEVEMGEDRALNRINPLAFASSRNLSEDATITALVHAARLGLFDMTWNMMCPGCGGVLDTGDALKAISRAQYHCSLCTRDCEPILDELVEVTFTVNPRIRRIAAHNPDSLPIEDYVRQIYFSSAFDSPDNLLKAIEDASLDLLELGPGERAAMSLTLPPGRHLLFDPVTHTGLRLDVDGEETRERRNLSVAFADAQSQRNVAAIAPGPVRISLENTSSRRTLPILWIKNEAFWRIFRSRRPYLTATRMLSNQAFRDLYRAATLDPDQRFKITSLTMLFTDLRGSTALYDRVGDLAAFDLVRRHFGELLSAVSAEGGAVVKTIGDAVMAAFPTPGRGLRAAMAMRRAMRAINESRSGDDLVLKIGLHSGPCLAVTLNDRQDYFGMAVNIASRVQGRAEPNAILATRSVLDGLEDRALLEDAGNLVTSRLLALRGVSEELEVFEFRDRAGGTSDLPATPALP